MGTEKDNVNDLEEVRKKREQELRDLGIDTYPFSYDQSHLADELHERYSSLSPGEDSGDDVKIAGRLMSMRKMGSIYFADVIDESGKIQVFLGKKEISPLEVEVLKRLNTGDVIGVEGNVFKTKTGELTVRTKHLDLLSKSMASWPSSWYGLENPDIRYRNRSLDMIMNPEVKDVFRKRTQAIGLMRQFLDTMGFLEVETPLLQPVYGGASARPFTTHVNALDKDYFLSVSPELYLKRILIGGFDRVYTICKNFRNEGIDKTHNPEFTMMECYQAFADYDDMMALTEEMYSFIFEEINGSAKVDYQGTELDFSPPWERKKMLDLVHKYSGVDVDKLDEGSLRAELRKQNLDPGFYQEGIPLEDIDNWSWGDMVQGLFEYFAEPKLIQPTFVIDHPKETTPLCKIHRKDERLIERFEPFVYGCEIGNAYSELNDPVLQRQLLEEQARCGRGGEENYQFDKDFCDALDLGMPPTGGLGLGVDRLVMFLTDQSSIKDVIYFPFMK